MKVKGINSSILNIDALIMLASLMLILSPLGANYAFAQNDSVKSTINMVQEFLDEDGDGFNDLLPDKDGDGIPDMIDPDFKGHKAESLYTNRYRTGHRHRLETQEMLQLMHHGEPGQYGPNDSTEHGGHHGGGGHGGGGMGGGKLQPDPGSQIGIAHPKETEADKQKKDLKSGK